LSSYSSYNAKIISLSDNSYSESGNINDISGKNVCYQVSFTLIKSGNYNVSVSINNNLIPQIEITVNSSTADYIKSITNIISRKSNYVVGEYIQFNIVYYDINENLVDTDSTFQY
jgi:citrate lyase alpha subunit